MTRVVAAHQPTFLPWLGWWDKLVRADVLVLLDDVQFPKKGGTWMNRVRMLVNGEPAWLTVPVDRSYHGVRTVRETRIDGKKPWRETVVRTIATNYGSARHFHDVFPHVEDVLGVDTQGIAELNETGIRRFAAELGLDGTKLVRQSNLEVEGTGTNLLVELCKAVDASSYLTGDGAEGYLEREQFAAAGIAVVDQQFAPPRYPQPTNRYVPGLSVVDALMSCGWQGTRALILP
jgi:hypothetical protein